MAGWLVGWAAQWHFVVEESVVMFWPGQEEVSNQSHYWSIVNSIRNWLRTRTIIRSTRVHRWALQCPLSNKQKTEYLEYLSLPVVMRWRRTIRQMVAVGSLIKEKPHGDFFLHFSPSSPRNRRRIWKNADNLVPAHLSIGWINSDSDQSTEIRRQMTTIIDQIRNGTAGEEKGGVFLANRGR